MKIKTKLLTMVSLMTLTVVMLIVGVWALKTVNFTVGGNLSYIAPGIEATISKGVMSNGVWVNAGDASTKMPLTQITRTDTEETLTTKFSYWQNLNMTFNEAGDDVTITFSITNDMADKYLSINVTTSYASADNATISLNSSSANLAPDASQSFIITMKVTDKTSNATLSSFVIVFHMEMADSSAPIAYTDISILTFSCEGTEAWFVGCTDPDIEAINLPPTVTQDGSEYNLVGICDYAFGAGIWGYTNLKTVIIPEGVLYLGEGAGRSVFAGCSTLTKVVLPNTLVYISQQAFSQCDNLKIIEVPDSVVGLGDRWISNMIGLESVIIGSGCTGFDYRFAFDCPSLKNITFRGATPPNEGSPFVIEYCDALENIYVLSGSVSAYQEEEGFNDYANLIKAIP